MTMEGERMAAGNAVRYQTWPPPPSLAPYVEHFWAVEGPRLAEPHREILIPNGRPTVLVCHADPGRRVAIESGPSEPNISNIAGILTKPIVLEQQGASRYVAAQLHPWGLKAFGLPPLVNATQPLSAWLGGDRALDDLKHACNAHPFGPDRFTPLREVLEGCLRPFSSDRLSLIRRAVDQVANAEALSGVAELTEHLGVSYHGLYKLFRRYLGISAKQYFSILRFYNFCGSLLQGQPDSVALLAGLQGYYDQPHAAREFRRYTGMNQSEFRTTLNGIAKLMHGIA